ncbi:hypothetical protein F5Y06DRAFT_266600 [Hypoxylon sp. FL0890]|nr:hypothetical protein F5Y06DRAFT_266600 [Hypoxylon sp. FL0890]
MEELYEASCLLYHYITCTSISVWWGVYHHITCKSTGVMYRYIFMFADGLEPFMFPGISVLFVET